MIVVALKCAMTLPEQKFFFNCLQYFLLLLFFFVDMFDSYELFVLKFKNKIYNNNRVVCICM